MQRLSFSSDAFTDQKILISGLNKTDISILDIGAHKGLTAKRYLSEFPNAEIYCFEPFPNSVNELQRKFSSNPQVHIIPKAVADKNGNTSFYVNEYDATNSLLPRPTSDRRYYPKTAGFKETINVEMIKIDDFLQKNHISVVDILKFDIQGGELKALQGAKSLLSSGKTSVIYTEIMFVPHYEGSPLFHELCSFLAIFDYSLFCIYNLFRAKNGQIRYGDAIFVSDFIRENIVDRFPEEP